CCARRSAPNRAIAPFPTRRSSDLSQATPAHAGVGDGLLLGPDARLLVLGQMEGGMEPHAGGGVPDRAFQQGGRVVRGGLRRADQDRKSTRLNSSHVKISYAVFCLK